MIIRGGIERISALPASALTGQVPVANGGTGAATAAAALVNLNLPTVSQAANAYIAGNWQLGCPPGASQTSTNANILTTDTLYMVLGYVSAPITVSQMATRTSGSNASVGAKIKIGILSVNAAMTTATRLGHMTSDLSITDAALSTVFSAALAANAIVPAGPVIFAVIATTATTQVRLSTFSNVNPWITMLGSSSASNCLSSAPIVGYTLTGGTYAAGIPSSVDLTAATQVTSITNHPTLAYLVA